MLVDRISNSLFARLRKDESGSMAVVWAAALLTVMIAVGAAFDLSQASKAKKLAQIAADNLALSASIAVDTNNKQRFEQGQTYSLSEIGAPAADFTNTMRGSVEYDVPDGEDKLLARATIAGSYTTSFMGIVGVHEVKVKAISDVAYSLRGGAPASVFFVADNSGSMGDSDGTGITKITSLENSLKSFMVTLSSLDKDDTADTFRTALYPYTADPSDKYSYVDDDGVIPSYVSKPAWGVLSENEITRMYARHGTDSSGALQDAADAFALEPGEHKKVNGEEDPLKFLVFMTDGSNNESYECQMEEVWVENVTAEYWWKTNKKGKKKTTQKKPKKWWKWNYVPATSDGTGYFDEQEVCAWDYYFDVRSLLACDQMKNAGVAVYAIAYDVAATEKAHAEEFMEKCSSGPEYFKTASDSSALAEAFDEIGASILEEVIRLKR